MKGYLATVFVFAAAAGQAGVPKEQISGRKGSVFITSQTVGRTDFGTGTLIGSSVDSDGRGHFCVLTNDHVISDNAKQGGGVHWDIKVAGAGVGVDTWKDISAKVIARQGADGVDVGKGKKWDLAVLDVMYGKVDDRFKDLRNNYLSKVEAYDTASKEFSSFGYGRSGDLWANEGDHDIGYYSDITKDSGKIGTQRYWNQKVDRGADIDIDGYKFAGLKWDLLKPDASRPGYGTGLLGDSGAGMMFASTGVKYGSVAVRTQSLRGVFSGQLATTVGEAFPNRFAMLWETPADLPKNGGWGLKITPEIKTWVDQQCAKVVPEPSGLAALACGLLVLGRKRSSRIQLARQIG